MADPEVIYLSVACVEDPDHGRTWSENGDGPPCDCPLTDTDKEHAPVKYVRADLALLDAAGRPHSVRVQELLETTNRYQQRYREAEELAMMYKGAFIAARRDADAMGKLANRQLPTLLNLVDSVAWPEKVRWPKRLTGALDGLLSGLGVCLGIVMANALMGGSTPMRDMVIGLVILAMYEGWRKAR